MMSNLHIGNPETAAIAAMKYQRMSKKQNRYVPMKIVPHRENTKTKLPKLTLVFDTEATITDQADGSELQTLRFGYALFTRYRSEDNFYESDYLRFENGEEFYDILERFSKQGTKLYCFAHNLGYDWSLIGINPIMLAHGWTIDTLMDRKGNTTVIYERDKHRILMVDTLNLFKMPLAQLAKDFGLEKGSVDFRTSDVHTLDQYCRNDVYILDSIIKQWREFLLTNNYGSFKATIASQALEIFKQKYLDEPIYTNQGRLQKQLERCAYYGGRTECNFIGDYKGDLYHIDINGAYPSVMTGNKFPYKFIGEKKNPSVKDLEGIGNDLCYFAEVAIESSQAFYPKRDGDKLIFPVGRFKTWLCEPECVVALRNGHIKRVYSLYLYKARPLFSKYVADIYRKRRGAIEGDNKSQALMFKLLGNALYGKFGEWRRRWQPVGVESNFDEGEHYEINLKTKQLFKIIVIDGIRYKYLEQSSPSHSFPLIAAFTTSYLRVKLLDAMETAGPNEWLYADTDSLVLTLKGFFRLANELHNTKLGKWKVEKQGQTINIRGLKDYTFLGESKIKGIPKTAKLLAPDKFEFSQFQSMHKTICHNLHGSVKVERVVKVLTREYYKGTVNKDGTITPYALNEFT